MAADARVFIEEEPPGTLSGVVRVALDVRMSGHSGIGTYIRGLSGALAALAPRVEVAPIRPAAPIYGLREQIAVPRAVARLSPPADILHVPHYNAPLRFRGRLVVTVHDLIHVRFPQMARRAGAAWYAARMIPRVCARAAAVICVSEATRRDLIELVPAAGAKTRVIYHGCDAAPPDPVARDAVLARHGLAPGFVLYVGNVRPHKNVDAAIRAWARLPEAGRPALVLAGEDQMPAGWEGRRRAGVRLLGKVPPAEVPALYAAAAAFVFPSLAEGFGFPPLEAMACGAPVLSSTAGGLAEVVGEAALTFDPRDETALATALGRVLGNAALREELGRKGRERARLFTWERCARETLAVYEAVIHGP